MADVRQLLTAGLEHYLNGRPREAASAWEEAIRLDPSNRRAREYLRNAQAQLAPPRSSEPPPPEPMDWANSGATAWDDGPSAAPAIVLEDAPAKEHESVIEEEADADGMTAEASAQLSNLMRGARELYALNDFSGALELLEKVRQIDPNRQDAEQMREDCVETLTHMYESQIGPVEGVPQMHVKPDEVIWLNLDHRAGFVLAQIDGSVSYDDLYAICGMSRLDTAKILAQLLHEKVIKTRRA